jgi:hypothetical protein
MVILFFQSESALFAAEKQPGGGRLQKTEQKTQESQPAAKRVQNDRQPKKSHVIKDSPPEEPNYTTEKIELWVDNQSLHASDRNIGSPESPFRSITAAVRKAAREVGAGEALIRVFPGIYRETVQVPKYEGGGRIILRGEDAEHTIISGGELLSYWVTKHSTPEGGSVFAHENVFPDKGEPDVFYVGSTRQKKASATFPGTGEFVIQEEEIFWMPPKSLDWRHAEISAPVRPYPESGGVSALVLISGANVHLESLTIKHCAKADAVVAINGAEDVALKNLRLTCNEAPGVLVVGSLSGNKTNRVLVEDVKVFATQTPFLRVGDADLKIKNSVMEEVAEFSDTDEESVARNPLILTTGQTAVHISNCLLSAKRPGVFLDISSERETTFHGNSFLQPVGLARFAFSSDKFSLIENFFLSGEQGGRTLTVIEMNSGSNLRNATFSGNSFQSNLAILFSDQPKEITSAPATNVRKRTPWKVDKNCLAEGANHRVICGKRSFSDLYKLSAEAELIAKFQQWAVCDPAQISQVAADAREKLRLLRD